MKEENPVQSASSQISPISIEEILRLIAQFVDGSIDVGHLLIAIREQEKLAHDNAFFDEAHALHALASEFESVIRRKHPEQTQLSVMHLADNSQPNVECTHPFYQLGKALYHAGKKARKESLKVPFEDIEIFLYLTQMFNTAEIVTTLAHINRQIKKFLDDDAFWKYKLQGIMPHPEETPKAAYIRYHGLIPDFDIFLRKRQEIQENVSKRREFSNYPNLNDEEFLNLVKRLRMDPSLSYPYLLNLEAYAPVDAERIVDRVLKTPAIFLLVVRNLSALLLFSMQLHHKYKGSKIIRSIIKDYKKFNWLVNSVRDLYKLPVYFPGHEEEIFYEAFRNHWFLRKLDGSLSLHDFRHSYHNIADHIAQRLLTTTYAFRLLFFYDYIGCGGSHYRNDGIESFCFSADCIHKYSARGLEKFEEIFPNYIDKVKEKIFSASFQAQLKSITADNELCKPFYGFGEFTENCFANVEEKNTYKEFFTNFLQSHSLDSVAFFKHSHTPILVFAFQNKRYCDKRKLRSLLYGYISDNFPSLRTIEIKEEGTVAVIFSSIISSPLELLNGVSEFILKCCPSIELTDWKKTFPPKKIRFSLEHWEGLLRKKFSEPDLRLIHAPGINGGSIRFLTVNPVLAQQIQSRITRIGKKIDEYQIDIPVKNLASFKKVLDKLHPIIFNSSSNADDFSLAKIQQIWEQESGFPIKIETTLPDGEESHVSLKFLKKKNAACFWHVMREKIPGLLPITKIADGRFFMPLEHLSKIIGNKQIRSEIDAFLKLLERSEMEAKLPLCSNFADQMDRVAAIEEKHMFAAAPNSNHGPSVNNSDSSNYGRPVLRFFDHEQKSDSSLIPASNPSSDNGSSNFNPGFFDPNANFADANSSGDNGQSVFPSVLPDSINQREEKQPH